MNEFSVVPSKEIKGQIQSYYSKGNAPVIQKKYSHKSTWIAQIGKKFRKDQTKRMKTQETKSPSHRGGYTTKDGIKMPFQMPFLWLEMPIFSPVFHLQHFPCFLASPFPCFLRSKHFRATTFLWADRQPYLFVYYFRLTLSLALVVVSEIVTFQAWQGRASSFI